MRQPDELPSLCRECDLRHRGMCGALTNLQLQQLSAQAVRSHLSPDDVLISDVSELHSYATVIRGVVKLIKILEDGRQQIVGLQFAPDLVGRLFSEESEILAEAATEVEVCRIPRPALERMVKEAPDLEHRLYEQAQRELSEARDWMVTLGRKTAAERVASFLYLIATHHDPQGQGDAPDHVCFNLPLSRGDIADFVGLTLETVSRQMSRLYHDDVIELRSRREVFVRDLAALRKRCG